jgi:pantoate--beta-alanine ligase
VRKTANIGELRSWIDEYRRQGMTVGFVPTMGYLHEGDLSLVDIAREKSDITVMSIYVNPAQFGPGEDFQEYPRDLELDLRLAKDRDVDIMFCPDNDTMYPGEGILTYVDMNQLPEPLCGGGRPGHFRGVMTVVAKLFNIVKPDVAVFGQKDIQQLIIIEKMIKDLNFPVEIVTAPIVREVDGLAMSSRNKYLNADQREEALGLYRSLLDAKERISGGEKESGTIIAAMGEILQGKSTKIDYISIVDYPGLRAVDTIEGKVIVAVAAFVGTTRLIDNLIVETTVHGIQFTI